MQVVTGSLIIFNEGYNLAWDTDPLCISAPPEKEKRLTREMTGRVKWP